MKFTVRPLPSGDSDSRPKIGEALQQSFENFGVTICSSSASMLLQCIITRSGLDHRTRYSALPPVAEGRFRNEAVEGWMRHMKGGRDADRNASARSAYTVTLMGKR